MEKEQTQTKRNHQAKKKLHDRKLKGKKQQAQTERSHRRKKKKPHEIALWGGFARKIQETRRRQGKQNASTNTKRTESHTFKGASRKPQLKDCKLKQDASTKKKKKTRHEIDLRGFSHEAAAWKVLRRKENESKLKWKKNKLKQNAITNQKKKKLHERKLK